MDTFFLIIGIITAFGGIIMGLYKKDIKIILAYSTISQIGLILIGLSLNNNIGYAGAMLHIINHALFKSLLFLAAGILISKYKTRNINDIRGVFKTYPLIGYAIIAGILGITGAPLFNGSISKYFIVSGTNALLIELINILINFGTILLFVRFGQVLLGDKQKEKTPNDVFSNVTLIILGSLCMLTGILGSQFLYFLTGTHLPINALEYFAKVAIWLASFILAWALYNKLLIKIKSKRIFSGISFNTIAASIVLFFTSIIIIGFIFY